MQPEFLKTDLAKFAAIEVEKDKKGGFFPSDKAENRTNEEKGKDKQKDRYKERRRREKNMVALYNQFL